MVAAADGSDIGETAGSNIRHRVKFENGDIQGDKDSLENGYIKSDSTDKSHWPKETEKVVRYRKIGVSNIEPPAHLLFKERADGTLVERKLVGIEGKWYDITDYADKHPGGPIISKFIGKDATTVFRAYRHIDITKWRKPVGSYEMPVRHPVDIEFEKLINVFEEKGWYKTDFLWYGYKLFFVFCLAAFTVWSVVCNDHWAVHYLGAVTCSGMIQQAGFIMHELQHRQIFRTNWWADRICATILGSVLLGISSHWWQDEHVLHHGLTNVVDVHEKWVDPQMWEVTWAQHEALFPLYQSAISWCLIKIQHITFVPLVIFVGRIEILTDSYRTEEKWYEWLAMIVHWVWMCWLLSHLPTWNEIFMWYFIMSSVEGVFHFQLILSHYGREHLTMADFHESSWYAYQILSNMNIECPVWLDWFYGGLQFHTEHHLFPKLNRKFLREAGVKYVRPLADKYHIEYLQFPFWECLWYTLKRLKHVGSHFKLDPR